MDEWVELNKPRQLVLVLFIRKSVAAKGSLVSLLKTRLNPKYWHRVHLIGACHRGQRGLEILKQEINLN
jgi:hypothetical protein